MLGTQHTHITNSPGGRQWANVCNCSFFAYKYSHATASIETRLASKPSWHFTLLEYMLRYKKVALHTETWDKTHTQDTCTLKCCLHGNDILNWISRHPPGHYTLFFCSGICSYWTQKHKKSLKLVVWLVRHSIWVLESRVMPQLTRHTALISNSNLSCI